MLPSGLCWRVEAARDSHADLTIMRYGGPHTCSRIQVADLKKELKARGLSDAGLKAALVGRLKEALGGGGGAAAGADAAGGEPSPKKQKLDTEN